MDKVRVLRVIEYIGTREAVERVIARSIHGVKKVDNNLEIRAATIGIYPEILENLSEDKGENHVRKEPKQLESTRGIARTT